LTQMESRYVDNCMDKIRKRTENRAVVPAKGTGSSSVMDAKASKIRVQSDRAQFGRTMSEIELLRRQHAIVYDPRAEAQSLTAEATAPPAQAQASKESHEAYEERMRRAAEEKADFLARQREFRLNTMKPHERVRSKLEFFREDERARRHLQERVDEYHAEQVRKMSALDLVKRNRRAVNIMSTGKLSAGEAFFGAYHRMSVDERVAEAQARKQGIEAGEDRSGFRTRREARRAERLEEKRQREETWRVLAVLSQATAVWAAEMEGKRVERGDLRDSAARKLTKQGSRFIMRRRLTHMRWAIIVLRRHVHMLVDALRERARHRSADRLRDFLNDCIEAARVTKAVREFVRKAAIVQRAWRRYKVNIDAHLGVAIRQFDKLVRTKRNVEFYLPADMFKSYMLRVAPKITLVLDSDSYGAPRDAKNPKGFRKKGMAEEMRDADGELLQALVLDEGRMLPVDVDTRDEILSNFLREGRREHMQVLNAWLEERDGVMREFNKQRDLDEARRMATGAPPSSPTLRAAAERAVLQEKLRPYPRRAILIPGAKLVPLVTDIVLRVGDKITAGEPIDGTRSLKRAAKGGEPRPAPSSQAA